MSDYPIASFAAALRGDFAHALMTSDDIVASEKAGQVELVNSSKLPKEGDWELLKTWGIEIVGEAGELFYEVRLPAGWSKRGTDHDMHSDLLDDRGRKRAGIFYKAAFYDMRADISPIKTRFFVTQDYGDSYSRDIKQWVVKDLARDLVLHSAEPVQFAYLASDQTCLGAIKGDLFWFSTEGEWSDTKFTHSAAATEAIPLSADEFYAGYHHVTPRHDVIYAAENLAKEGLAQKISDFIGDRDQWDID